MTKYTFEQAIERLENISETFAQNNVTLDESLKLYSEAVKLLSFCNEKINTASLKIKEIESGNKGEDK
ncbi:MAG: exodeoxyribonuclease VII small subunit [Oscillospiraceae bacterium]